MVADQRWLEHRVLVHGIQCRSRVSRRQCEIAGLLEPLDVFSEVNVRVAGRRDSRSKIATSAGSGANLLKRLEASVQTCGYAPEARSLLLVLITQA